MRARLVATYAALVALTGSLLAGCPMHLPGAAPSSTAPGALLSSTPVTDPAVRTAGLQEWWISYGSRSGLDEHPITVTGVVFVPPGKAPAGGWPVVSWAHGTTGVGDDCAPSHSANLLGELPVLTALASQGYVVTATDYEGLGTPGPHPYLQPTSEGRSVIDAVRAARALVPGTSTRWVAVGASQGGQAAWAAAEIASEWGLDLTFLGAVAFAPVTDLAAVVDDVPQRLSPAQKGAFALVLTSLKLVHPELDYADYLSGKALTEMSSIDSVCSLAALGPLPAADFTPRSPQALARARQWLAGWSLPQPNHRAAGPLFVAQGTADNVVRPAWTLGAVRAACKLGDVVQVRTYQGAGHPAVAEAGDDALRWIADRFAGKRPPSGC